ncbi:MAG: alpha/beta fold hydrolase [Chrysiogenetes bacterium]|nr:alpha/beta fold hydrolase [Chrysiogenetes bacterium]
MRRIGTSNIWAAVLAITAILVATASPAFAGGSEPPAAQYPIIIGHGFGGGLGSGEGFGRIPAALREDGHSVFITKVSAFGTHEVRGEQMIDQVEEILAISGKAKVNLIGHSAGGQDVRYAAHVLGASKVASVTTLGTAHRGNLSSELIMLVLDGDPTGITPALADAFFDLFGLPALNEGEPMPQDFVNAMRGFTRASMHTWNEVITNAPGVYYQSYGGTRLINNLLDPADLALAVTGIIYGFEPNDGLTPLWSSGWGNERNLRLKANHMDLIDQTSGMTGDFSAPGLFKDIARDLQKRGY